MNNTKIYIYSCITVILSWPHIVVYTKGKKLHENLLLWLNINKPFTYVLNSFTISVFKQVSGFYDNAHQLHQLPKERYQMFTFCKNHIQTLCINVLLKLFLNNYRTSTSLWIKLKRRKVTIFHKRKIKAWGN